MVDAGRLYEMCPLPDIMLAQHVGMSKAGLVAVRTRPVLPAPDYIEISVFSDGVGPNPAERPKPVNLASYLVTRFQGVINSDTDDRQFSSLVCRDFHAGDPEALFTNRVELRLELKTCEGEVRDQIVGSIKANTEAECAVYKGLLTADIQTTARAPVTRNDTALAEILQQAFGTHFGDRFWVPPMDTPVEDFANLSGPAPVPFVYWKLGSTGPARWGYIHCHVITSTCGPPLYESTRTT